ncbi:hypothetical protein [Saccharicrinis fermentans]|uniref:Lipoprotein n=1 Tax=Saccharicrinis fermentans DSM 9555 = JCM 21142 TaxID=869213 RepID=W7XZ57_9BACT|nr:hypothetical protein [Saccharicrinis fermentans]GAF03955.1 hypothetical protein JCM21142_72645 [Saccharicrinis fermentans DSM 9555 = JCM 21142]
MKLKQTIGLGALAVCLTFGAYSCKSKEKVATNSEVGEILQDMPCEKNGKSDKNYFRAFSMATSSDLSLSKEKALLLAKQRLVTLIQSNTKSVTDRYVNEREVGSASEFEQKFENLTREVADQTISNIVVACEKSSVLPDKKYRSFVAIEVEKEELLNSLNNSISKDVKLQVDYDKKKYEEIFNQEMEKMAEESGY